MVLFSSCATRHTVSSDYYAHLRETPQVTGGRTVVLFLIDGLSVPTLKEGFDHGVLPEIRNYFLENASQFQLGRAVFPSLTFPNITSILTQTPVDQHPILGNQVMAPDGTPLNYEKPWNQNRLYDAILPQTIFTALSKDHQNSVSLSYYFNSGATVHVPIDVKSSVAYLGHEYDYVDHKLIDSLESLLSRTSPSHWPELIFVHLIGVDSLAHTYGPHSPNVLKYFSELDGRMKKVFKKLREAENQGHQVISFLTADHGFTEVKGFYDLERVIQKTDPEITVLNQHRLASLYFPLSWNGERRAALAGSLAHHPAVEMVMQRRGNEISIQAHGSAAVIRYREAQCAKTPYELSVQTVQGESEFACPEVLDRTRPFAFRFPHFYSLVSSYFYSSGRPDAVILAADHISFSKEFLGDHGGLTPEEIYVPVLMRNAEVKSLAETVPTYELLKFMRVSPGSGSMKLASLAQNQPVLENKASFTKEVEEKQPLHTLEISAPTTTQFLESRSKTDSTVDRRLTRFRPGLELEWAQRWSSLLSSEIGYQIGFPGFDSDFDALQRIAIGGGYRFGDRETLWLTGAMSEQWFSFPGPVRKMWIPELGFGTRSRVLSLGFGDLSLRGGLGVLFPSRSGDLDAGFGFKEMLGVAFEVPVRTADLLSATLRAEHFFQDSSHAGRSGWSISVGLSYGMAFIE